MNARTRCIALFALAGAAVGAAPALAEPVVYEGTLSYLDAPVDSSADLRFRLFDSAEAGAQLGDTIELPAHALADGAFKATLDFGASAAGWLEVSVRAPAGDGDYVTLTPRQRVEPGVASIADAQARAAALAAEEARSNASLSLSRNTSRSPLIDPAGAGFDPNAGPGGAGGFGNPDDDYTVGPQGLWVSSGANTYYTAGNVGIGTMTPSMPLEVRTTSAQQAVRGVNSALGGYGVFGAALGAGGVNFGVFGLSYSPDGSGVFGQANSATGSTFGVTGQSDSSSGIGVRGLATSGTGTPIGVSGTSVASSGFGVRGHNSAAFGNATGVNGVTDSTNGFGVWGDSTANGVADAGIGVLGTSSGPSGDGVRGQNTNGGAASAGVRGIAAGSGWGGHFSGGQGLFTNNLSIFGTLGAGVPDASLGSFSAGADDTLILLKKQVFDGSEAGLQIRTLDSTFGWDVVAEGGMDGGLRFWRLDGGARALVMHMNREDGWVGVGREATANDFEVEGTASKTAAGDWAANSDRRIKTQIQTVTDALDTLDKVRLVSFEYTDAYKAAHPSVAERRYLNVIAQEFAEVFPEHVHGSGELLPDGSEILQVDTYPLTIYAAAAVQELRGVVDAKDARIAALESRDESITAELDQLRESIESIKSSRRPTSASLALPLLAAAGLGLLAVTRTRKETTR